MPGPGSYWIGEEEKQEVADVLESGHFVRYGMLDDPKFKQKTLQFEKAFAQRCNVKHALATATGSTALASAMIALGLKPGDEIILPAYGFVADHSVASLLGIVPVIAEIGEDLNIDPEDIEARITLKTKAIVPIHMLGNPCNMDAILDIANRHGLPVLEDVCQATGGSYHGQPLGSLGALSVFSLNVFKVITTGDGGVVATNDGNLYDRAFAAHDQGYHPFEGRKMAADENILGMKFCMTEMTAAVGLAQLRKLNDILATLREKKAKLKNAIGQIPGTKYRTIHDPTGECATLCTIIFDKAEEASRVAQVLDTPTVEDTGWHVYSRMDHLCRHLKSLGLPHRKGDYPRTDDILSRSINLSVGVVDRGLGAAFGINIDSTDEEIEQVAKKFRQACGR